MPIKKFTMKEVDEEIMQIVQQQTSDVTTGNTGNAGPQDVKSALLNRAKIKR